MDMRQTCFILFLLLYGVPTNLLVAQDSSISRNERPESEVTAAINPSNPNNIIVAAINDFDSGAGTNKSRLSIYYTLDFGETWEKSLFEGIITRDRDFSFIGDPVVSFDDKGVAYLTQVVWLPESDGINTQIYVSNSSDEGLNWATELITSSKEIAYDKPWIAVDIASSSPYQGTAYVTYVEGKSIANNTSFDILLHRKTNTDIFFSKEIKVNTNSYAVAQYPNIASNREGQVFVSFVGNDGQTTALYVARSEDGGLSFKPETKIVNLTMYFSNFEVLGTIVNQEGLGRLYPCSQMTIDNSQGPHQDRIYLTWTDKEANPIHYGLDVFLSYSDDQGQHWSEPTPIVPNVPPFVHQYYSSIAISDVGTVLLTWYDRKEHTDNIKTDYFFSESKDGGVTFENIQKLTSRSSDFSKIGIKNGGFGIGEYTQMVHYQNKVMPFWADGRQNNGNIQIYHAILNLEKTTPIQETPLHPQINVSPNPAHQFIELQDISDNNLIIDIYSIEGKKMDSFQLFPASSSNRLNVNHLPTGIYFLQIKQEQNMITGKRFVKY